MAAHKRTRLNREWQVEVGGVQRKKDNLACFDGDTWRRESRRVFQVGRGGQGPAGRGCGPTSAQAGKRAKQLPAAYFCTVTSALAFQRPNDFRLDHFESRDSSEGSDWLRRCPFEPGVDQSLALLNFVLLRSGDDESFVPKIDKNAFYLLHVAASMVNRETFQSV